jgi:uncharacterized membrane protein
MHWYIVVRWIHILAATAWFGKVVTINFVLVPAVSNMGREEAAGFLKRVFPKIFRLASVLSATTVICGLLMAVQRFAPDPSMLWTTFSGTVFLVGATMGLALTVFHFVLEPRLDGLICLAADQRDFEVSDKVVRMLRVVPRGGLVVITGILVLMMVGTHGI